MLLFSDAAAIAAAPTTASIDAALRQLIADRVHDWIATDLLDRTHLIIVHAGDTEADIINEVGFSPLINPLDGERFGSPDFQPPHDWLQDQGGFYEIIYSYQDGFAFVLFVEQNKNTDPELRALCQMYAEVG